MGLHLAQGFRLVQTVPIGWSRSNVFGDQQNRLSLKTAVPKPLNDPSCASSTVSSSPFSLLLLLSGLYGWLCFAGVFWGLRIL